MLAQTVEKISAEFLNEAKNSPRLLTDMASMERYLAESYGDRILIELLQNADDAMSTKTALLLTDDTVFFANNGRPFTDNDLVSICRSGASQKTRGIEIGYRGVGFKSTTSLTNDIIIYSDETYFTFSKDLCAAKLNVKESDVPTVRIPFVLEKNQINSSVLNIIEDFIRQKYSSVFVFKKANKTIINDEILKFDKSSLLFLKNINELNIKSQYEEIFSIKRAENQFGFEICLCTSKTKEYWWLPIINKENTNFAFKMDENGQVIECEKDEAVFHCFLPTLESCPFKFKINGDFSTDPSRKHLILDDRTKDVIKQLSDKLRIILQRCINNDITYNSLMSLLCSRLSYGISANVFYIEFANNILNNIYVNLNNDERVELESYLILDDFFQSSEKQFIRKYSKHINSKSAKNNSVFFEDLISKFSKSKFELDDYLCVLQDKEFVERCENELLSKIYGYVLKGIRTKSLISNKKIDLSNCYIKIMPLGIIKIIDLNENTVLDKSFVDYLQNYSQPDDFEWLLTQLNLEFNLFANSKPKFKANNVDIKKTVVSRWRSAEQQCVEIEIASGNKAKYVGNKNLGYDIESTTPDGKIRYIEVKLLSSENGIFTMTNNEYSSAHQLGDDYFLCVLNQREREIKVTYIRNPIINLQLEKRVKQWEWYCEEICGDDYIFPYEN